MKKITLLAAVLFATMSFGQIEITNTSGDDTITNGVLCDPNASSDITASYTFALGDFGVDPASDFAITQVRFGASSLTNAPAEGNIATVSVYTVDGVFPGGALTLIESQEFAMLPGTENTLYEVPFNAVMPGDSNIVLEVASPNDGSSIVAIGTNNVGDGAISYASGCAGAVADPTDLNDFGLTASWVIEATGDLAVLSVNDNVLSEISVSPNPATTVLNLDVPSSVEIENVTLFDILGKATNVSISNGQVNISSLSRGVYILNVNTNLGVFTEKIIID